MTGLFGGAFDPPHAGHVALARAAKQKLGLSSLLVLVSERPAHKEVVTPADVRLEMARAAFPDDDVELDPYGRTVELLEAHPEWDDPAFVIGADQFRDFPSWTRPDDVLELTRLAVGTRPGFPREQLEAVLDGLEQPERIVFFDIPPTPVASRELRARLESGQDVGDAVPSAVARIIDRDRLYGR